MNSIILNMLIQAHSSRPYWHSPEKIAFGAYLQSFEQQAELE
jgi:hypothetical protein